MRHSKLKRTAYHEAGHAVMSYELRRRISHVSIIPDAEAGSLGHIQHGKPADMSEAVCASRLDDSDSRRIRLKLEGAAMISFAGSAAVDLLTGGKCHATGSGPDYHDAVDALFCLTGPGDELHAYANWLYERTKGILAQGYLWQAVEALASELLTRKYIGGKQARQIIKEAILRLPSQEVTK